MIDQKTLELILNDYQALNHTIKRFHQKIAFSLVALLALITLFLGFGLFHNHDQVQQLVLSVGFILIIFILIALLYTFRDYAPQQAKYSLLYPAIYHALNQKEAYFKRDHDITNHINIHQQAQLFSHGIRHQRIIQTETLEKETLFIYDISIVRTTQRANINQFQGVYYRLLTKTPYTLQIRTKGKPAKGDIDFQKINQIGPYTLFSNDEQLSLDIQKNWIDAIETFAKNYSMNELYLSLTPNELTIAISPSPIPPIKPPFTTLEIKAIGDFFLKEREMLTPFRSLIN